MERKGASRKNGKNRRSVTPLLVPSRAAKPVSRILVGREGRFGRIGVGWWGVWCGAAPLKGCKTEVYDEAIRAAWEASSNLTGHRLRRGGSTINLFKVEGWVRGVTEKKNKGRRVRWRTPTSVR